MEIFNKIISFFQAIVNFINSWIRGPLQTPKVTNKSTAKNNPKINEDIETIIKDTGIEIQGSEEFSVRTKEALKVLIPTQSFREIKPYISIIKEAQRSGMQVYGEKPTYEVGEKTWKHSVAWYASTIVHDGYHSKLYHDAKAKNNGNEPGPEIWSGTKAEKNCLKFQLKALEELKADEYIINYIKKEIENPTYHLVPYKERNW